MRERSEPERATRRRPKDNLEDELGQAARRGELLGPPPARAEIPGRQRPDRTRGQVRHLELRDCVGQLVEPGQEKMGQGHGEAAGQAGVLERQRREPLEQRLEQPSQTLLGRRRRVEPRNIRAHPHHQLVDTQVPMHHRNPVPEVLVEELRQAILDIPNPDLDLMEPLVKAPKLAVDVCIEMGQQRRILHRLRRPRPRDRTQPRRMRLGLPLAIRRTQNRTVPTRIPCTTSRPNTSGHLGSTPHSKTKLPPRPTTTPAPWANSLEVPMSLPLIRGPSVAWAVLTPMLVMGAVLAGVR